MAKQACKVMAGGGGLKGAVAQRREQMRRENEHRYQLERDMKKQKKIARKLARSEKRAKNKK